MNERLTRVAKPYMAEFITAFDGPVSKPKKKGKSDPFDNAVWLVWRFEVKTMDSSGFLLLTTSKQLLVIVTFYKPS